jgi:hypothetical protein
MCAWLGGKVSANGLLSITEPAPETIVGGCIGLLLGLAVCFDERFVQRQIEERERGIALASQAPPQPAPVPRPPSEALALVMLAIPLVTGALIWQREFFNLTTRAAWLIGSVTILSTAVLGYLDMRRLVLRSPGVPPSDGRPLPRPAFAFLGILALWLLAYPVHFLARRRLGARNFIAPGLAATGVFLAPTVLAWFSEPTLPPVGAPEVVSLVEKIIEDSPMYQARKDEIGKVTLREPVEVSFDSEKQRRVARGKLVSKLGEDQIFYTVQWQDRKKGMFAVQVFDREP